MTGKKTKIWRVRDRYYDRKKKSSSRLLGPARSNYDRKKKKQSSVRCYAVPNTTGKKKKLAGARSLLQPEKKVLVVYLVNAS